jgi:hypothetical protein
MRIGAGHTLLVPASGAAAGDNLLSVNLPIVKPTVRKAPVRGGKFVSNKKGKKKSAAAIEGRRKTGRENGRQVSVR